MQRKNTMKTQSRKTAKQPVRKLNAKELKSVAGGIRITMSDVIVSS
jgi:hypothetical protein